MKKLIALLLAFALTFTITACSGGEIEPVSTPTATPNADSSGNPSDTDSSNLIAYITLSGNTITIDSEGAIVEGNKVSITAAGTYYVSGASSNAQIRVYTKGTGTVKLILNGADIACPSSAPIYIINADKTVITLADGTENYITDGSSYTFDSAASDEPDAAIFSNDDLTINGNGSLTVNANYNDGIKSDDDLRITGGVITVDAADDGIIGRDSLTIKGGNITVNADGDGIKASNDEDAAEGYISIEGGTIDIIAGLDGIQAETNVTISGGDITITSGGGSANAVGNPGHHMTYSAKAIKAGVDIVIENGLINTNSYDDSFHSNGTLTINNGYIIIASGDDGVHTDSSIEINGGNISITKCYEGIESATTTINGGIIRITSRNDGINIVENRCALNEKAQGLCVNSPRENLILYVNGGSIFIDAGDDGIDVNGLAYMTGGVCIISLYGSAPSLPMDFKDECKLTGGLILAVRDIDMSGLTKHQLPSDALSVVIHYQSSQPTGTVTHIESESGQEILTYTPTEAYSSVLLCSPELQMGTDYIVYYGGSSTGTIMDGLYSGGTYTPGTELGRFTITNLVTHVYFN